MSSLRLATRRSPLAVAQAELVQSLLRARGTDSELVLLDTTGDRLSTEPLREVSGEGIFAVEIQRAVLDGRAHVAVHSAKDLPSSSPEGLTLAAAPQRADPADVLVGRSLAGLGPGATVATGSPRRRALLLERRPDLHIVELRGNMATRVAAVGRNGVDAIVAAAAALERLGWLDLVSERLDPSWFVPQAGQGSLALEVRSEDEASAVVVASLSDPTVLSALRTERAYLRELGAGCAVPVAAHALLEGDEITLLAVMMAPDGSVVLRTSGVGTNPEELGARLARELRDERGGANLWSPTPS